MAAHGVADRSQDTFTALRFRAGTPPAPTTTPVPAPTTVPARAGATPAAVPASSSGTPGLATTGGRTFDQLTLGLALLVIGLGPRATTTRQLRTRRT